MQNLHLSNSNKWLMAAGMGALIFWFSGTLVSLIVDRHDYGFLSLFHHWRNFNWFYTNQRTGLLAWSSVFVAVSVPATYLLIRAFAENSQLYGKAHFMSTGEIKEAGLLQDKGVLLGRQKGRYICASGQIGVILVAPPRSGKGIGPIISNILNYNGSVFVMDIRGETYDATSGFRAQYGKVYRISPLDPNGQTHCFNPFDFLSKERSQRISQVQTVSNILLPTPEGNVDPMWANEGRDILEGVILYLYDSRGKVSLGEVARFFKASDNFSELLKDAIAGHEVDSYVRESFLSFMQKADKEQSGVASTVKSSLKIFLNPQIEAATSRSDFNPYDLRKQRITVYLNVSPDHIKLLKPYLAFFTQTIFHALLTKLPDKQTEPYSVLAILDEFPAMGRLDAVKEGLAYFAGYNVVPMIVCQDNSQLYDVYGEHGGTSILSSMIRIYYACNNEKTAQSVSTQCGSKTARTFSVSHQMGMNIGGGDVNRSLTQLPLITPDEIMQLPSDQEIILVEKRFPILCNKLNFLTDKKFQARRLKPIPLPERIKVLVPEESQYKMINRGLTLEDEMLARLKSDTSNAKPTC